MKSIDNLRDYVCSAPMSSMTNVARAIVVGMTDEIEREVEDMVPLPLDADGDVLHIGELVDEELPFGGYAAPAPIDTMELSRGASGYVWMMKLDAENRALINPKLLRRHHSPTVEDVLREYALKCEEAGNSGPEVKRLAAEYAAKLLAGENA